MKEEDLTKAIGLKKILDDKRELLKFANSEYVDLRVNLEERSGRGRNRDVSDLLDDNVIEELKAKVFANIEKNISDLQEELEKL
jgi:hypothetical protein